MKWMLFFMCAVVFVMQSGCGSAKLYHDMPILEFDDIDYGFPVQKQVLNGVEVAYYDGTPKDQRKNPIPIVLIHGLASHMGYWKKVIPELESKGYRVIAIDLPGYGKSAKAYGAPYTLTFYAKTVNALLTYLSIPKAIWTGHSMGGQISLVAALSDNERMHSLILAAPAGFEAFNLGEGEWLKSVTNPEFIIKTPLDRIRANFSNNFFNWDDQYEWMIEERVRLVKSSHFERFAYAVWKSVAAMIDEPVWDKLEKVSLPTLIIAGENDNLIPNPYLHGGTTQEIMHYGQRNIQGSTLVLLPETGHMLILERSGDVVREIAAFLK